VIAYSNDKSVLIAGESPVRVRHRPDPAVSRTPGFGAGTAKGQLCLWKRVRNAKPGEEAGREALRPECRPGCRVLCEILALDPACLEPSTRTKG
jgi:hypothetical protein